MSAIPQVGFFADLDVVMDSRLATLWTFGPEVVENILCNGYLERPLDKFIEVDESEYKRRYESRGTNSEIFKNLQCTPIVNMIREFIVTIRNKNNIGADVINPKIYINIYPYKLSDNNQNMLLEIWKTLTNNETDIDIVDMSNDDITPKFVYERLGSLVKYDAYAWLEHHCANGNFAKRICPDIALFAPAIFEDTPSQIALKKLQDSKQCPFKARENIAKCIISLKYLDVSYFSMNLGKAAEAFTPKQRI